MTDFADIATSSVSEVSSVFKRVYLMALDAVPDSTPLTAQLNRTTKFKGGPDGLHFNVKLETGGKTANVPDGKLLPTPSRPIRRAGKADLAHTYTVVAIGGQTIPLTSDTRNAFVDKLKDELEDGMTRVKIDLERQYNGDGDGILCLLETVAAAPTYDVHSPYGVTGAGPGTMLLIEGMEVALINPSGGAERGRQTISTVDVDNEQMTVDGSFANDEIGDFLVLCNDAAATGTDQANNYQNEATGILAVAATGDTFENIDQTAAGNRRWAGIAISGSGQITEKKIAVMEHRLAAAGGQMPDLYYTTRGMIIDLGDQLSGLRQISQATTLKGGFRGVNINGRDLLPGDFCPKGHFFGLHTASKAVGMADLVKMGYVDLDGAKLHRVEGRHAYRADLWFPHQALWFKRNAQGVSSGHDDDNTIVR